MINFVEGDIDQSVLWIDIAHDIWVELKDL